MEIIKAIILCIDFILTICPFLIADGISKMIQFIFKINIAIAIGIIIEVIEILIVFKPINKSLNSTKKNYTIPKILIFLIIANIITLIFSTSTGWNSLNLIVTYPTIIGCIPCFIITLLDIFKLSKERELKENT